MSSTSRAASNTKQGNDFFINVAQVANGVDTYSELGVAGSEAGLGAGPFAAGTLLVKDMGKTVRITSTTGGAEIGTYRKVQAFVANTGTDTTLENITFYIKLHHATTNACPWARMTLQA